jgi:integrase
MPLIAFLEEFWDYTTSPYIKEKLAHGQTITQRYCLISLRWVYQYWKPAFPEHTLATITRQDLKQFSITLAQKRSRPADIKGRFVEKFSSASINHIMLAGTSALAWAAREGYIPEDPTKGLVRFSGGAKKRGVLTPAEVSLLFAQNWRDRRALVGNFVAMNTGLRAGEVLALRKEDIEERTLTVRHSWNPVDGLKCPKNGEARRVPLLPAVKEELLSLACENPHGEGGFIFYSLLPDKPMDEKILLKGLHEALEAVGIDWRERNIVFHSWRHYYAARLADRMSAEQIMRITGHKSKDVYDEYADHITEENLEEVGRVSAEVFGNVVPFRRLG